jgi:hypothetical protein
MDECYLVAIIDDEACVIVEAHHVKSATIGPDVRLNIGNRSVAVAPDGWS